MNYLDNLSRAALAWIAREPGEALLTFAVTQFALLALCLFLLLRQAQIARRQTRLLRGADGANLETMLLDHVRRGDDLRAQVETAAADTKSASANLRNCLQRVGVSRFDAFPDVGGRQSFAVALLDADRNGLVLSGLHSRQDVRVYAKPIIAGASPIALTDEEKRAIARAQSGGPDFEP